MKKISPFRWLKLKTALLRGLINFKIFLLNISYEGGLQISSLSKLFHLINGNEKKELRGHFLLSTGESLSYKYFLFGAYCYLKELSQN